MKVIEKQMLDAIHNKIDWNKGNTKVSLCGSDDVVWVYLHHNLIARISRGVVEVVMDTLKDYPTNTTKSRLRALGVNVTTKRGVTYLNGVAL